MLANAKLLKGFVIRTTDGEIGAVDQLYFDDETWAIRYFTIETGSWLAGRQVLISPISIVHTDWQAKRLDVALTKKQVENSPNIDTHRPVSRQDEATYSGYYGYPYYWGFYPAGLADPTANFDNEVLADKIRRESTDSHLRSTEAVLAITLRRRMVKSVTCKGSSSMMMTGLSATWRWQHGIGGRARRYWFRPHGFNG
jgi:hypothetical protein